MTSSAQESKAAMDSPGFVKTVGELGADVLSLAELQTKLGWEDLKIATRKGTRGLVLSAVAVGCALGGTPVVLLGIAELLIEASGWRRSAVLLGLGGLTIAVSVIVAILGARLIFRNFAIFRRSRDELIKNLEWLKQVSRQVTSSWNRPDE